MKKLLLLVIFLIWGYSYSQVEKNVLFIGNSQTYVNDLPFITQNIASSVGDNLIYDESTFGGYSFLNHLNNETTLSKIRQGNWDYVVLQGRSGWPSLEDSFVETNVYPYAKQLNDSILKYNPCSKTVFYHTWGYQNGYSFYCPTWPPVCTYEGMDDLLQLRYPIMAEDNEAILSPVGPVWRYLNETPPIINLYDPDGTHPSLSGSYAGALTFYTILFNKDPNLVDFNPGIFPIEITQIKDAVTNVVYNDLSQWYIGAYDPLVDFTYTYNSLHFSFSNNSTIADSYHWNFGDGNTSMLENPEHIYNEHGVYQVTLTITHCGSEYSTNETINTSLLSANEVIAKPFRILPNPVTNNLYLNSGLINHDLKINIYNLQGKLISSFVKAHSKRSELDVAELKKGLYFIQIEDLTSLKLSNLKFVKK